MISCEDFQYRKIKNPGFLTEVGKFDSEIHAKHSILQMLGLLALQEKWEGPDFKRFHKAYEKEFETDIEVDKKSRDRVRFIIRDMYFDLTRSQVYGKRKIDTTLKRLKND